MSAPAHDASCAEGARRSGHPRLASVILPLRGSDDQGDRDVPHEGPRSFNFNPTMMLRRVRPLRVGE